MDLGNAASTAAQAVVTALSKVLEKGKASTILTQALMSNSLRSRLGLSQPAGDAVAVGALVTGAGAILYATVS